MPATQVHHRDKLLSIALSLVLHGAAVGGVSYLSSTAHLKQEPAKEQVVFVEMLPPPKVEPPAPSLASPAPSQEIRQANISVAAAPVKVATPPAPRPLASMPAPPAPSSQEWALAGTYTLKNSKRYRHNWGQQVRSMMGTAVEGPDQGQVRFRIEIAPDGTLARLETLWSTSPVAEQLARAAVQAMPPLPPTPTGQPLVFEKTITFSAFHTEEPPIYRYDCDPDTPAYGNRFAWDGKSPMPTPGDYTVPADANVPPDPTANLSREECLKLLPPDTVEAESAHDKRKLEQWRSRVEGQPRSGQ
jgi:TonB family protein